MKNETNIANVCKDCDYSPAFCDGDVCTCESAHLYGTDSEIGRENVVFEKKKFKRDVEPGFRR